MFTNHKLQLYVQIEYKTQSENSIKILTIKAQRSTYALTSIEHKQEISKNVTCYASVEQVKPFTTQEINTVIR